MKSLLFVLLSLVVVAPAGIAQTQPRPIPYPIEYPIGFDQAIRNETRTTTGHPGPEYWTNTASYQIAAEVFPESATLRGTQRVTYRNNSPETIHSVVFHLRQNLHRPEAVRNRYVPITRGMNVARLDVQGQRLSEVEFLSQQGYVTGGTLMTVNLPEPIAPGGQAAFDMDWEMDIPPEGAPRMGHDGEVFFLGYWYPQLAVYDDVHGWKAELYQGSGEFYMGYGDYDVSITVPEGWLVAATGVLTNASDVLSDLALERLERARTTDDVVHVLTADEAPRWAATRPVPGDRATWTFRAEQVRDFAFGTSDRYAWDATRARTGALDDEGRPVYTMIHALYRPGTPSWNRSAEFTRFSIEHMSEMLVPYPYPHMTSVEGIIGGGMEYPMITLIGGTRNDRTLFRVTYHEVAHMWFPMMVGNDEKEHMWMDEGKTSFNTNDGMAAFFGIDAWEPGEQAYFQMAGSGMEVESMRHSDEYPFGTPARGIASYSRPAVMLHVLRGLFGEERFFEAYREYARRWTWKHPQPWDLFNTFEDVLGEDLGWFWRSAFFETWTLEHFIDEVTSNATGVHVVIVDEGNFPMPAPVRATYADGTTREAMVPVEHWLGGARQAQVSFPPGRVVRVEIDPGRYLPHVDRWGLEWMAEE
jgi:hypothetical protein